MTEQAAAADRGAPRVLPLPDRSPAPRLGVAVVEALVDLIVSGALAPGDTLPPELPLSQQFGVSRTVLRESIKRLEEKGLVSVGQGRGRGTVVQPTRSWNTMDRVVLKALIAHDRTLGVLDELTVVRGQLEAAMAGETARTRSPVELDILRGALEDMRVSVHDAPVFNAADVTFHEIVMAASGNRLAESIARVLFERARESARYDVATPLSLRQETLREHERVFRAIEAGLVREAEESMRAHICDAWTRRRPPDHKGTQRLR
ncbi:FadR/GntR family transcriptional regulator [Pseudonocardia xinjiangensis]|uniref:FadR/GntR family transcriptional regulator n=1 Tax=Pseudonocardia xinjiangensis TaxID=75289 RepID=UPI003D8D419C